MTTATAALLQQLDHLTAPELRRLLAEHLTRQKLGLYWERDAITHQAKLVDAQPLPDVMVYPQDLPLEASVKNIYGVLPPSKEDALDVDQVLFMDERHWWADQVFALQDGTTFSVGRYDGAVKLTDMGTVQARLQLTVPPH